MSRDLVTERGLVVWASKMEPDDEFDSSQTYDQNLCRGTGGWGGGAPL